jgi:methyl-accepting chemotaxis protein
MNIANLRIGTRLGLGFGVLIVLVAGAIGLGLAETGNLNALLRNVTGEDNVMSNATETMRIAQLQATLATANVVLLDDEPGKAEQQRARQAAHSAYSTAADVLRRMATDSKARGVINRIDAGAAATRPLSDKAHKLGMADQDAEATAVLLKEVAPAAKAWQAALDEMVALQNENDDEAAREADAAYRKARLGLCIIGLAAIAIGTLVGWLATRSITTPIGVALHIAKTVAAGDLTLHIAPRSRDEAGQLIAALKAMNDSLLGIVAKVRSGTDNIASASTEIANGNLDLSSRTEQQASSLEETAASMEELTATVKNNADHARQANALAASASDVALKGGQVVTRVVGTMNDIDQSSRKIVDIISVIDGIAFQTNILALNAAVEAARAGEQGRGFAVVASEVRNLAQRSATAAKEIKQLIDDSVAKVAQGSTLVNEAGSTMDEVVASVRRVTDIMAEISAAGQEQETGIAQINQAVIEMDSVTQQNAALVEEAAAAAESLQRQARHMTEVVSVFRLPAPASASAGGRGQAFLALPEGERQAA